MMTEELEEYIRTLEDTLEVMVLNGESRTPLARDVRVLLVKATAELQEGNL